MIDEFCIFERGGTVLWRRSYISLKGNPLAVLVRNVLLEDRLSLPELNHDCYTLRWLLDNERGLIFAVIFQRNLPPAYANDLLQVVRKEFVRNHAVMRQDSKRAAPIVDTATDHDSFTSVFEDILDSVERKSILAAKAVRESRATFTAKKQVEAVESADVNERDTEPEMEESTADTAEDSLTSEDIIQRNRAAFLKRPPARRKGGHSIKPKTKTVGKSAVATEHVVRGKVMRKSKKSQQVEVSGLDHSTPAPSEDAADNAEVERFRQQFMEATPNTNYGIIADSDDEDEEDQAQTGGVFNFFKGLAGMRNLTREDLQPVMDNFRESLISKNVAQDIADKIIESVLTSLEGKRMETMTSVTTTVRKALDEALTRVLTSRQTTDILSEIAAKKATGRPFVITYCGVNGVGKSTSLAKTCFYLLNHGHKVLIAACDTFRAGAVEQLRVHVKCLGRGVELFERGYGKDAAAVAADAIRHAKEIKYDVVLVDTAGRMQDNEPLMRALAKLVDVNKPDRLFFVGEALVGNDAVDQLTKFNQALADHHTGGRPRLIDGIVLTKFDTIDDKVGAAVSMVYTTGQPIVFVGVGQTYMDLRKVNTTALVKALLK